MRFTSAAAVENVVWQMRLADWPRARNRAKLNDLYNGFPPYDPEEQQQNRFATNVNFLEGSKILHDARRQFQNAFSSGQNLFSVSLDYGPVWKRRSWSEIITNEINKMIRNSRLYQNCRDSVFALNVLHGVGPSMWENRERWCPYELGIEDVLVPSDTYTSLRNLPFFAIYRRYTGAELWRLTHRKNRDPGWNMDTVRKAIQWVDRQAANLMSANWPEVWSPEKMSERIKQDSGLYASDAVPTIDAYDIYSWNDNGRQSGWNRQMILDAWGNPGVGGAGGMGMNQTPPERPKENKFGADNQFLYNSGNRIYASKLEEIIHFQFADASCVAPFRYHSVRSLGFLLYAVCHLQNRLRCRFNDHVFENLLQYFRVSNPQDAERLSKIDLMDKGIIPDGLSFVTQQERWQINQNVAQLGMDLNRQTMADNSASFTQDFDIRDREGEETATRTMAKVNATAAMIGGMLARAYTMQEFQYLEMCRRFCVENSSDPDVRKFRVNVLKQDVPEEALNSACWEVRATRVIGSGNKMMQVAMADKLWAISPALDPQAQQTVKRLYILANSDDPGLAEQLVPDQPQITRSMHDAQNAVGTLLKGHPVSVEDGMNHVDYIQVWMHALTMEINKVKQRGGVPTPEELTGMMNLAYHVGQHLQLLAQDKRMKQQSRKIADDLKNLQNEIKGFGQRLMEMQQKAAQQNGNGQMSPEDQAKIQAKLMEAQSKAQIQQQSHAQKTAQRQIQFEQQMRQDAQKHEMQLAKDRLETAHNLDLDQMRTESDVDIARKKSAEAEAAPAEQNG